ncbi:hypothetical protein ACS8E2_05520 [Psychrobacter glaciei]|uniref:hypothetical protein n=1 Tax=Psychrobacter glaciei TaxID=619771 RepID=UPI003F47DFAF
MNNPKITMMSTDESGNVQGNAVLNGHEWVVKPFQVASDASASEKENKLIEQAISVKRAAVDKQEMKLMDWVKGSAL